MLCVSCAQGVVSIWLCGCVWDILDHGTVVDFFGFPGGIADLRGRAEQIVAGEKGYFKLSNVVLQNVPVKYGACYYYACGQRVGTRSRLCLRELDEDGRGIHNVWTGSRRRLGVSCGKSR